MRIVFAGSGEFAVPALRCLVEAYEVALVITQPDRPAGRGRHPTPTPVREMARELGYEALAIDDINRADVLQQVELCGAELGIVAAFGQKLRQGIREAIPAGWVNIHASLLPAYRGAAPIAYAIRDGCQKTGITVFRLVERMDAGPILVTRSTMIGQEETREDLEGRLAGIACDAIKAALELFRSGVPAGTPQDESAATRAPKLTKADGRVDFNRPAASVSAHIRAMWPWPGATCSFVSRDGRRHDNVTLAHVRLALVPAENLPPGQIDERLHVATADGFIELLEIKPEGGRLMPWPDFVNGRHVRAGDRFERQTD